LSRFSWEKFIGSLSKQHIKTEIILYGYFQKAIPFLGIYVFLWLHHFLKMP